MNLTQKLNKIIEDKPERMGMYAIQTDHPGLMKGIDKKSTTKVDRSFLAKDEDAEKEYIKGKTKTSGKKYKSSSKITEKIENRLLEI
jgi:hypothetical protein